MKILWLIFKSGVLPSRSPLSTHIPCKPDPLSKPPTLNEPLDKFGFYTKPSVTLFLQHFYGKGRGPLLAGLINLQINFAYFIHSRAFEEVKQTIIGQTRSFLSLQWRRRFSVSSSLENSSSLATSTGSDLLCGHRGSFLCGHQQTGRNKVAFSLSQRTERPSFSYAREFLLLTPLTPL